MSWKRIERQIGLAGWNPSLRPPVLKSNRSTVGKEIPISEAYVDQVHNYLCELLTQCGPLAGTRFDARSGFYARPDLIPMAETYGLINSLHPQCLACFKQGANGNGDFVASGEARLHHFNLALSSRRDMSEEISPRPKGATGFMPSLARSASLWLYRSSSALCFQSNGTSLS